MEKYKINAPETVCHLYYGDTVVKSSNPDVRVTWYECPGGKYLFFLSNKTKKAQKTVIDLANIAGGNFEIAEEWTAKNLKTVNGKIEITVPARAFRILAFPPQKFYPYYDGIKEIWHSWKTSKHDTGFSLLPYGGINNSAALQMTVGKNPGGCFTKSLPIMQGKTYTFSIMAKKSVKAGKIYLGIQARSGNRLLGAAPVSKSVNANGKWQKITLVFTIPAKGKWASADNVLITVGGGGAANCNIIFDDFKVNEK